MKTPIIVLPLLFLAIFIHSADERANMLKIFEADPIPDEMMAKIHALSNGSELSPEMVAHLKACEATAHTPDYTNYKRSSTWGRVLPESRFFKQECYAVPSRPLYYESFTQAGETPADVIGFLVSGSDERAVQKVAEQLRYNAECSSGESAKTKIRALGTIAEERLRDVDVVTQRIEHGCEVIMAAELHSRLLADMGSCTHKGDACSTYHARVKAWLKNQEKASGSKDLAIILFASIRGSIITE